MHVSLSLDKGHLPLQMFVQSGVTESRKSYE